MADDGTPAPDDHGREFPHLHREAQAALRLPKEERIAFAMRDRWIDYPAARRAMNRLSDLMARPVTVRSRGVLLAARPDNGKSTLLARFAKLNQPRTTEDGETVIDFVLMRMPDKPTEDKIWSALLRALRIPHDATKPARALRQRAERVLDAHKTRLLAIDDIHNYLQGSAREQGHALVLLKTLAEDLKMHLAVAGTGAALTAMVTDDQVATRFFQEILPPWRENETLRTLLAGLEAVMPLPAPSGLSDKGMLLAIAAKAYNTIGGHVLIVQLGDGARDPARQGEADARPDRRRGLDSPEERRRRAVGHLIASPGPWPWRLPPIAGESLTSCLIRNARAHGDGAWTFMASAWPGDPVWERDFDADPTSLGPRRGGGYLLAGRPRGQPRRPEASRLRRHHGGMAASPQGGDRGRSGRHAAGPLRRHTGPVPDAACLAVLPRLPRRGGGSLPQGLAPGVRRGMRPAWRAAVDGRLRLLRHGGRAPPLRGLRPQGLPCLPTPPGRPCRPHARDRAARIPVAPAPPVCCPRVGGRVHGGRARAWRGPRHGARDDRRVGTRAGACQTEGGVGPRSRPCRRRGPAALRTLPPRGPRPLVGDRRRLAGRLARQLPRGRGGDRGKPAHLRTLSAAAVPGRAGEAASGAAPQGEEALGASPGRAGPPEAPPPRQAGLPCRTGTADPAGDRTAMIMPVAVAGAEAGDPGRECLRCGRTFAGKAGRMIEGKPACPSCGNALRPAIACAACLRKTKRPGRLPGQEGLVCERCLQADTHATCRTCRRHRRVSRRDAHGRALCAACGAERPVTHACPDCGSETPGTGLARCHDCSLADRIARSVVAEAVQLRQDWVRDLFTGFCGWDRLRRARGDMPRHVAAYARFFAILDRNCAAVSEITQARLIELHGAEGLRCGFQAVAFLADRLSREWVPGMVIAATEQRRVVATVAAANVEPWAGDLDAYRRHLADGGDLAPNTTRMYVAAAAALLRSSGVKQASELTQRHLARHLRGSRGRRNNLLSFLSWASDTSGQRFDPGKARRKSAKKRERATLKKAKVLLDRLGAAGSLRERRALLASATGVLHGLPLSEVLALRRGSAPGDGCAAAIGLDGPFEPARPLAEGFRRIGAPSSAFAFPGRNGLQPLSTAAVRHHLRTVRTRECRSR